MEIKKIYPLTVSLIIFSACSSKNIEHHGGVEVAVGSYRVIDANVSREESIDIGEVVESKETIVEAEGESHLNLEIPT